MTLHVHPDTQKLLDVFMKDAPHAIILTGKKGVGLGTITHDIAKKSKKIVLTVLPEKDEKVDIEKGTITVQSIRRLYDITKTIEPNGRIIVIDYAERMGAPAQNAFLKLLEEPVEGTQFILLTHQPELLLPTIISRSQLAVVKPVDNKVSQQIINELKITDPTKQAQLLFIAGGLPAELHRLASDDDYFQARAQVVKDAREFVTGSAYSRLQLAHKYKNDRNGALILVEDASRMVQKNLASGGSESLVKTLQRLEKLHLRLSEQGNVKLQLSSAISL